MADRPPPVLNGSVWRTLRANFQRKLPREVTPSYLGTVLDLKESPAKNVLRNLKLLGLVGEENEPTELAARWRDDEQYADACEAMVREIYPDDLLSAAPGPHPDAKAAAQWFQRSRLLGLGAAKNAARTYVLIASAELPTESGSGSAANKAGKNLRDEQRTRPLAREEAGVSRATGPGGARDKRPAASFEMPRPQIAVQVNISPDMTPEQIDQIFASMARHLYSEVSAE